MTLTWHNERLVGRRGREVIQGCYCHYLSGRKYSLFRSCVFPIISFMHDSILILLATLCDVSLGKNLVEQNQTLVNYHTISGCRGLDVV